MRRGFTLIELLVVISIIALLIAILIPALSKSTYVARIAICKSNLHQVAVALTSYSVDNDGFYLSTDPPGVRPWKPDNLAAVADYFGQPADKTAGTSFLNPAWQCPQGVIETNKTQESSERHTQWGLSYYAVYANAIRGVHGGFYQVGRDYYLNKPQNALTGPEDTRKLATRRGVSGLEYKVLASDICVTRWGNIMTNHIAGGDRVQHESVPTHFAWQPLYIATTTGQTNSNFAMTDGSVDQYDFKPEDIGVTMNEAASGPWGGWNHMLPIEWGQ